MTFGLLWSHEWDAIERQISESVPSEVTGISDFDPREAALQTIRAARLSAASALPKLGIDWLVRIDPSPGQDPDAGPWPLTDWWDAQFDLTAYYKKLAVLLAEPACDSVPVAERVSERAIGSFEDDGAVARPLAAALWAKRETCPGIKALVARRLNLLREIAEPPEEDGAAETP